MTERQAALCELLHRPFDDGYARKVKDRKLDGKPDRYDQLPRQWGCYVAWRHHDRDGERLCD